MADCFEFRRRSCSDSMTLMPKDKTDGSRLPRLVRMFRCKSEEVVRKSKGSSPQTTPPSNSPGAPRRRRMMRVVRDNEREGEEYENPYLIRHYSKAFWEKQMEEARALQHSTSLPYSVNTDHTILKKHQSTDSNSAADPEPEASPTQLKHASFQEEVEVMEFHYGDKIASHVIATHRERLLDSSEEEASPTLPIKTFEDYKRRHDANEFTLARQLSIEEDSSGEESEGSGEVKGSTGSLVTGGGSGKKKGIKDTMKALFKSKHTHGQEADVMRPIQDIQATAAGSNKENVPASILA